MSNEAPKTPHKMSPIGAALFEMGKNMAAAEMRVYERHGVTTESKIQACREVGRLQRLHQPSVLDALRRQGDA